MFVLNSKDKATGAGAFAQRAQVGHVLNRWQSFSRKEAELVPLNNQQAALANGAAYIPRDVFVEFENQSTALLRDNNLTLMQDLMPLAKAAPLGKVEHVYRTVSDSGVVVTDLDMTVPAELDKAAYDYKSAIKVFHKTAFGRTWMEMEGQRSEGFDALIDDQANATRRMLETIAEHIYNGVDKSFNGTSAYGIKTSADVLAVDLDVSDLNIDFTSAAATAADIRAGWVALIYKLRTGQNVTRDLTFYISAEIEENFQRIYDSSGGMADSTIMEQLKRLAGVADIKVDEQLSGNEVVYGALSSEFIRPIVGMGVTTVPLFRGNEFDDYRFMTWSNLGLQVKTDYAGKTGWGFARNIT